MLHALPAFLRSIPLPVLALLLGACSTPPPASPAHDLQPVQWMAPLPHEGSAAELAAWWAQFDDPLLSQLIDIAEHANPTLALATGRIAEARASVGLARSQLWPAVDAKLGLARSNSEVPPVTGTQTTSSASLDAAWEIDLFGAARYNLAAAQARAETAETQWHDARVSLAAEVAQTYVGLRACEAVSAVFEQDADSLRETAGLVQQKVEAGFDAPANLALARASAAEAANRVVAQRADCDVAVKQLVALTAQPEADLRQRLAERRSQLPRPAGFAVETVPARLLAQRPDVAAAERNVAAASADVGTAQADRYPRLALTGSIGFSSLRFGGQSFDGQAWSIGPALSLPVFDAGRRRSAVEAAEARYDQAVAAYRQRVLVAVQEVEESLGRLDAAGRREADAALAASGYAEYFAAAQTQWEVGTGSLLDLELARRSALAASASLVQVQRERVAAWVALYKAVGGAWQGEHANLGKPTALRAGTPGW
jgi:NodT family efflux transporter outer membrane factor (OMF) lipoprotein